VTVGGNTAGDIITTNANQTLTSKSLTSPIVNGYTVTANGNEINKLTGVSLSGNIRTVQQGTNIGNAEITSTSTITPHGYNEVNITSDITITLTDTAYNITSEIVTFANTSTNSFLKVNIVPAGTQLFFPDGATAPKNQIALGDNGLVRLMATRNGWLIVSSYSAVLT